MHLFLIVGPQGQSNKPQCRIVEGRLFHFVISCAATGHPFSKMWQELFAQHSPRPVILLSEYLERYIPNCVEQGSSLDRKGSILHVSGRVTAGLFILALIMFSLTVMNDASAGSGWYRCVWRRGRLRLMTGLVVSPSPTQFTYSVTLLFSR